MYFRILKSGCRIEKLQHAEKQRFDPCLALYMIIAWRILYLTVLSRECPEVNCELIFSAEEWKIAHIILKKAPSEGASTFKHYDENDCLSRGIHESKK